MRNSKIVILSLLVCLVSCFIKSCKQDMVSSSPEIHTCFKPAQQWTDTEGNPIQSHFGSIFHDNGTYYWIGQNYRDVLTLPKGSFSNQPFTWNFNLGITIYSSVDLYNWTLENIVLNETSFEPGNLLQPLNLIGRANIIKNDITGKYILMGVLLSPDFQTINDVIWATSDSPAGPYEFKGKLQWNGIPNLTDDIWNSEKHTGRRDSPERIRGWDMKLFTDDDNKTYLIVGHRDVYIYELSDDFQSVVKGALMKGAEGEAPAMVKDNGTYYLFTSRLTGYKANCNTYFTSDNIWGPYEPRGKFASGPDEETTFRSQVAHVFPLENKPGKFIFISGRYNEISGSEVPDFNEFRHIWLPLEINRENRTAIVRWRDEWVIEE